jgi:starch-binding outer membrane protein, SusD/RagB family
MKKIQSILAILALLVITSSCKKYLDLTPQQALKDQVALSSDANVKSVLVSAYAVLRNDYLYGGNILRNSELVGGTGEISWQGTYNGPREIYNHMIIATNGDITSQWLEGYRCINICNSVLSAIDTVKVADRNRVQGEALYIRSLMYFDLVLFYAKQYEPGTTNSQLGVPLVLNPTTVITSENNVGRNTVEEVYNKVIADLKLAVTLLPEENGDYATVGAANALLARVYLQKSDFAGARDAADKVIASGLYTLTSTYAAEFNNTAYTSEDIFAMVRLPADLINQMTEFWSTTEFGGRDGDIEILQAHLDLYAPDDQRLALFWIGNDAWRSGKWNSQYGLVQVSRLAEMYLIRAECNQRLGTSIGDTPVNDFNAIHTRAGLTAVASVTLADILYERRLELAHEGLKLQDMKRLKLNIGVLASSDPKILFPLPEREISANPALAGQQNEGY